MRPSVSAIIPCKDRPKLLQRALASIADQTVRPDEVIVVDDGSEPPLALSRSFPIPLTVIRQENRGPGAARNRAIAAAAGEWIAPLDSDDTWVPEKTEYQLDLVSRHAGAGFCVSDMTPHGRPEVQFPLTPGEGATDGLVPDALERLLPGRFISTSGVMFSKAAFDRVGGFDEGLWFCEDHDLWVRLAAVTGVVSTTRRLNDVYREGDNLSDVETHPRACEIIASIFERLKTSPLFEPRIQQQAARILGQKLYDLAYMYRKHGQPAACCWASVRSLWYHGPLIANLKNFAFCGPDWVVRAWWTPEREVGLG
jgi:glycosyltransferase involved in cell wall biosynthesis